MGKVLTGTLPGSKARQRIGKAIRQTIGKVWQRKGKARLAHGTASVS